MKIDIVGIEKTFELKIESTADAKFSFLRNRKIKIINKTLDKIFDIIIPAEFKTDLATIPRIFWNIFPPIGTNHEQYGTPAALHDYLYSTKIFDRKICDQILLQAIKQKACTWIVRYSFYCAVRIFGNKHYK